MAFKKFAYSIGTFGLGEDWGWNGFIWLFSFCPGKNVCLIFSNDPINQFVTLATGDCVITFVRFLFRLLGSDEDILNGHSASGPKLWC